MLEDYQVGRSAGSPSHERTLGTVAVSPRTENRDDATARIQLAGRGDQISDGIVGVRVIHDDQEWLPLVNALEAARNSIERGDTSFDVADGNAQAEPCADCSQNVVDVDAAHQM